MSMGKTCALGAGYVNTISHTRELADHASVFGALSKTARLVLQSAILAVGAYLVIEAQMSPGAMIASSVMLCASLAIVIGHWRNTSAAGQALRRLRLLVAKLPKVTEQQHGMPRPRHTCPFGTFDRAAGRDEAHRVRSVLRARDGRCARDHRPERLREIDARASPGRRLAGGAARCGSTRP